MTNAKFDNTDLSGANFSQANAQGVFINGLAVEVSFTNANLTNADLSKGDFTNATFFGANLTHTIAVDAIGLIVGNAENNTLNGTGSNDNLNGDAGNDNLDGGAGADTLNCLAYCPSRKQQVKLVLISFVYDLVIGSVYRKSYIQMMNLKRLL